MDKKDKGKGKRPYDNDKITHYYQKNKKNKKQKKEQQQTNILDHYFKLIDPNDNIQIEKLGIFKEIDEIFDISLIDTFKTLYEIKVLMKKTPLLKKIIEISYNIMHPLPDMILETPFEKWLQNIKNQSKIRGLIQCFKEGVLDKISQLKNCFTNELFLHSIYNETTLSLYDEEEIKRFREKLDKWMRRYKKTEYTSKSIDDLNHYIQHNILNRFLILIDIKITEIQLKKELWEFTLEKEYNINYISKIQELKLKFLENNNNKNEENHPNDINNIASTSTITTTTTINTIINRQQPPIEISSGDSDNNSDDSDPNSDFFLFSDYENDEI